MCVCLRVPMTALLLRAVFSLLCQLQCFSTFPYQDIIIASCYPTHPLSHIPLPKHVSPERGRCRLVFGYTNSLLSCPLKDKLPKDSLFQLHLPRTG